MSYRNSEKILLILDLDETLIYGTEHKLEREESFKVFDYYIYKRPYIDEFIQSVKDEFLLAVWSSASDDYVQEVVNQIISSDTKLEFVWGRSRCTYKRNIRIHEYGYYDGDYHNHYNYVKPLKKVKRKGFNLERILIVDDTPHKSQDNYGNAIYPLEYKGESTDDELKQLEKYLMTLKDIKSVRHIEKRNWRNKISE